MTATAKSLLEPTAADLMSRDPITISHEMSLRAAAQRLFKNQISGAPVVDRKGRCIGMLCASDFVHWAAEGAKGVNDVLLPVCPYQIKGHLLTGEEAVICMLAEGSCPFQQMRPTTGGRHAALCLRTNDDLCDWRQVTKSLPTERVSRYITADVVTVGPQSTLSELARTMIDAHIHRVIVVDEEQKPVGIVSSTDILAAVAYSNRRP